MKLSGRSRSISPFRKLVIDLMHFCGKVPPVTLDRTMDLAPLVEARSRCTPRPSWTAIITKAYSIVAAKNPILRTSYMTFPWARFHEHPKNVATINVSREADGEKVVLQGQIRSPENRPLMEVDSLIHHYKTVPVEEIKAYQRARRMSRLPGVVRRALMWLTLNWMGRQRCHNFGTFSITSVGEHGAGILNMMIVLTTTLHYGLFTADGKLNMRLTFDHRVIDGGPCAEALAGLEKALLGEILAEVRALAPAPATIPFPTPPRTNVA